MYPAAGMVAYMHPGMYHTSGTRLVYYPRYCIFLRCRDFLAGRWRALWVELPPVVSAAELADRRASRAHARGFTHDPRHASVVPVVRCARLSHACRLLESSGAASDVDAAHAFLRSVHFDAPAADPAA
eukprot:SAG11_NODE_16232_length_553_cov_1.702643_1_plen_127_part_10